MFGLEELKGRVVWLTGASGGLGSGIAIRLAEAGMRLALHYHTGRARTQTLVKRLAAAGAEAIITSGDLTDPEQTLRAVKTVRALLGQPYALVHAAGPVLHKPALKHTREEFDRMLAGNLTSFFEAARVVVPGMRREGTGRVIAFGMAGAHETRPMPRFAPHLAAKAGLIAFARTLALEEAAEGITVNVISPGNIPHKRLSREEAYLREAGPDHPMGHHGSWEDVADAVLYLLSPAADYITGTVLEVTGGWLGEGVHHGRSPAADE